MVVLLVMLRPLTKVRSCADAQRASALYEFMLNFGLRADSTWSEWDCVTRVGWRHESRESQVDYLFSFEETTLLDVWVDSSLVCDSDHLAVVGRYQTARNARVSGRGNKKRIPCALRWTANDPVAWEKGVGGSGEFGADWRDPLAFLGFLARTADAHKIRRKCEKDQVICDLKVQLQDEGLSLDRDEWFFCGEHVRRNDLQCNGSVAFTSIGWEFLGKNLRRRPSGVSTQTFLRSLFRLSASCKWRPKTSVFWNGGDRWTMGPRRLKSPHVMSGSVWPSWKKDKSSPDGVTAEMLLALSKLCALRKIYKICSPRSISRRHGFGSWRLSFQKKPHPRGLNEFRPISCLTPSSGPLSRRTQKEQQYKHGKKQNPKEMLHANLENYSTFLLKTKIMKTLFITLQGNWNDQNLQQWRALHHSEPPRAQNVWRHRRKRSCAGGGEVGPRWRSATTNRRAIWGCASISRRDRRDGEVGPTRTRAVDRRASGGGVLRQGRVLDQESWVKNAPGWHFQDMMDLGPGSEIALRRMEGSILVLLWTNRLVFWWRRRRVMPLLSITWCLNDRTLWTTSRDVCSNVNSWIIFDRDFAMVLSTLPQEPCSCASRLQNLIENL